MVSICLLFAARSVRLAASVLHKSRAYRAATISALIIILLHSEKFIFDHEYPTADTHTHTHIHICACYLSAKCSVHVGYLMSTRSNVRFAPVYFSFKLCSRYAILNESRIRSEFEGSRNAIAYSERQPRDIVYGLKHNKQMHCFVCMSTARRFRYDSMENIVGLSHHSSCSALFGAVDT